MGSGTGAPVNNNTGHPVAAGLGAGGVAGAVDHHHHAHHPGTGAGHPLATGAAVGATTAAVDHHHHHNAHNAGTGVGTGVGTGLGTGTHGTHTEHIATHDPAAMDQHGNPLYPSPHAPASGVTGATGLGGAVHGSGGLKTSSGKSPSTQAFIGKVEHAVGTIISSETLKAKGIAKEQEAIAVKNQAAELSEAERLEAHAGLARDRANQHAATGAIHSHQHGAVGMGAAPTNVGEIGQASQGIGGIGGAPATRAI